MTVVGYASGVFDMFHVGHLNVLRRAKLDCDYLIAGVVTDDVVQEVKGKRPVVSLFERMEIVQSIRFVDEVVPDDTADKFDMWERLKFDVFFKGDDWKGTLRGDRLEAALEAVGARVCYLPYTPDTSSTLLRQVITVEVD
jgi:glycerol-3-phosphate cytidylyltransferase